MKILLQGMRLWTYVLRRAVRNDSIELYGLPSKVEEHWKKDLALAYVLTSEDSTYKSMIW